MVVGGVGDSGEQLPTFMNARTITTSMAMALDELAKVEEVLRQGTA